MSEKGHSPYRPPPFNAFQKIKPTRCISFVVLLCIAFSLSSFVSQPWSFFRFTEFPETDSQDPADSWEDNIWPFRHQTPWDISTDFPHTRSVEYDVTEGTWLRLDVHPKTGDIVFDMLGDIYCLPGSAYLQGISGSLPTQAVPVLLGVPHESDPHFSPDGNLLAFRSDAELGVENIWVVEWTGCANMNLRPAFDVNGPLASALKFKEREDALLAQGVKETSDRRERRLIREGRLNAQRITNETYRWISDPRFHPSGSRIVATKWYTSSRSLGAGEAWEYPVPNLDDKNNHVKEGSGKRIIGRTLPKGWSAEQYPDQQIGPEQFIWKGTDSLIYSKNVIDDGTFTYSKDVHKGIYAIFSRNLTTGMTETLVDALPGGASRPELSRDQRTLAFVRRVRDKEVLVFKDLKSGTLHHVFDGLTYDLGVISAPMGTYPSFAFTPSDDAVIIWAAGQIYHIPLILNDLGEKIVYGSPRVIPFEAHIEKRITETLTHKTNLLDIEASETQYVHAFKGLQVNYKGSKAVFEAAGQTYVQGIFDGSSIQRIPALHPQSPYYSPVFVHAAEDFVLQARWSNSAFTTLEIANLTSGVAYELTGIPVGRYVSPVLCECSRIERKIAFVKSEGDYLTGNVVATTKPGLYIGDIDLPTTSSTSDKIEVRNLQFVATDQGSVTASSALRLRFMGGAAKLLVQQSDKAFFIDLTAGGDEFGVFRTRNLAEGKMSDELIISTRGTNVENAAFLDFFHIYFAPGHKGKVDTLWSKPGKSTAGLARLSLDGGHDVTFSGDGERVFWFLGSFIHSIEISKLKKCSSDIRSDSSTYGISCIKDLVQFEELHVEYKTDISRLKGEANSSASWILSNVTVLTMDTGYMEADLIENAFLVMKDGLIHSVTRTLAHVAVPPDATIFDAHGSFVVPGFIDSHAHWNGWDTMFPATSWELQTFLAYGVTTMHNPSSGNRDGYIERFRVENNQLIGPRIYHTGNIIYGAGAPGIHQDIVDMDEAYSALIRIQAEGGPASFSYKNYNLPSRASRQRLLTAAKHLGMLCVPEGGMNYEWDLTYIIDGMTTLEHAVPVPALYDDVMKLFLSSGTSYTPTHIVNYGGTMGEQFIWASHDIPDDSKLRRFIRHDELEALFETTSRPKSSFQLFNTSISAAKMVHQGLKALVGAHGEQPLGLNFHAEMFFTQQGGLTNYETLRAATSDAAKTFGLFDSLGSITEGKLADLVVYQPTVDLINGDIWQTKDIQYVVRGGRMWDAETMEEIWPVKGRVQEMPPFNVL